MSDFVKAFLRGVRETPRGFFAPLIVLWRSFEAAAEPLPHPDTTPRTVSGASSRSGVGREPRAK